MKILGVPGVKPETESWMRDLLSGLQKAPFEFEIAQYRHWSNERDPDANHEASCLADSSIDFVIAKSLGTIISTLAFDIFNFKPRKAIFIGSPLRRHSTNNFKSLSQFVSAVPTLFIQQTSDFNGSYSELAKIVQTFHNGAIVEVPGEDHLYDDINELQNIILPVLLNDA